MADSKKITAVLDGLKGCFVAGGAVTSIYTNKPINDFDIYPKSEEALRDAILWAYEDSGYWCVDHSSRAMTFANGDKGENPNIQIMHFDTFETAEKIFECFDFTVCMGAYDLDEGKFVLHEQFLEHCSQRFISFNRNTRYPYASARRVKKYEERGYTIGTIEFQKILLSCAAKPITTWDDLKEQIGGVYGEAITIPDDEEFSADGMWKAMETLKFKGPAGGYENAEEAIACVSNLPVKCFKRGDILYADIDGSSIFKATEHKIKNVQLISISEAYQNLTFYKAVVVKPDGTIMAPHYRDYTYKIGELNVSPKGPGIFIYSTIEAAKKHYGSVCEPNKTMVLELQAESEDDINFEPEFTLKKAMPIRLHEVKDVPVSDDDQPF